MMLVEEEVLSSAVLLDVDVKAPITSPEFEDHLMEDDHE